MFTNLTSYFWGGGSAATPAAEEMGAPSTEQAGRKLAETGGAAAKVAGLEEVVQDAQDPTLMTSTEEEDWLMVDSHLTAGSEDDDDNMEDSEVLEDLHPLRPDVVAPAMTLPPGMEESWIIAPTPTTIPCLVESAMEVSPLETLLIEHPSMSVYHKLESPVRSLKLSSPLPAPTVIAPSSSPKPEAPTIEPPHQLTPPVQSTQGSQTKKLVVKKTSSNQKSKQPAKPPQIPFILRQKAQKHKSVPESPTTLVVGVAKPKPAASSAQQQRTSISPVKPEVVPNKMPKTKSKKVTTGLSENKQATSGKKLLGEIQNVVVPVAEKPAVVKVAKKPAPAPMNRIVECNIKEMFPTHVYPKDMRPFVEDFQNNAKTRQHRELIAAQRRSQLAMTRARRSARRNPFTSTDTSEEVKTEAAAMMEQKENNVVEMRRQEQFEILLRSSQKQQQKRLDQNLRKNHLSRNNRVIHEMSARNKRQRRNDHSNKPSGANNNRKSQ